jgi:hypothetical protein
MFIEPTKKTPHDQDIFLHTSFGHLIFLREVLLALIEQFDSMLDNNVITELVK